MMDDELDSEHGGGYRGLAMGSNPGEVVFLFSIIFYFTSSSV